MKNEPEVIETHDLAYPLPVTLYPSQMPKKQFEFATEIQSYFNELIHRIANDYDFLKKVLENVISVDEFTKNLWLIYETVHAEGFAQVKK